MFGGLVVTDDASPWLRDARGARGVAAASAPATARLDDHRARCRGRDAPAPLSAAAPSADPHASIACGIDLPTLLFEDDGRSDPSRVGAAPACGLGRDWRWRNSPAFRPSVSVAAARPSALRDALRARGLRHQEANDPGDHPLFVTLLHPQREALRRALLAEGQDTQPTWMRSIAGDDGVRDSVADAGGARRTLPAAACRRRARDDTRGARSRLGAGGRMKVTVAYLGALGARIATRGTRSRRCARRTRRRCCAPPGTTWS